MQVDKLRAKVEAVNISNKYATELKSYLDQFFGPLVGQKIYKNGSTLLDNYKNIVPSPADRSLYASRILNEKSLGWSVHANVEVGKEKAYHCAYVYVGKVENQILTELCPPKNLRHDFDFDKVYKKLNVMEELVNYIAETQSELRDFCEFMTNIPQFSIGESDGIN